MYLLSSEGLLSIYPEAGLGLLVTLTKETSSGLNAPNFDDLDESNLTSRDTRVVQAVMEEGLTVFTFDGLKRLLGLHQEKLSRIIDRLEEEGVVEKVPEGYRVTVKGNALIPRPLNSAQAPMPIVQSLLPRDVDLESIVSQLKGRWFGKLRWLGYSKNEDGVVLKWIAEEDGFQIDAKFSDNYLSIDAKVGETGEASEAVKAAHLLLGHVSRSYSVPRHRERMVSPIAFYTAADFA
jgi:DNA-binding MarR family transcriptional regulator